MTKKTRSARGEMVDFDLIQIKTQIASTPKTVDVKKREDFIDRKLRRRIKRVTKKVEGLAVDEAMPEVEIEEAGEQVTTKKPRKIVKKGK